MSTSESSISQLIPIDPRTINGTSIATIDARCLYAFLEVKTEFSHWITRRIETYGFVQDIDFCVAIFDDRLIKTKEYHLSLPMAKELAMVERTVKGKEARLYFLECERQNQIAVDTKEAAMLAIIGKAIAIYVPHFVTPIVDARLVPMENAQHQVAERLDAIEHQQDNLLQENKDLLVQCALQGATIEKLNQLLDNLIAPDAWITIYTFMQDLKGAEQREYRNLCLRHSTRRRAIIEQFEMYACNILRERDIAPREFPNGRYMDYFFPSDVLLLAFEDFKKWVDENPQLLGLRITSPLRYVPKIEPS